MSTETTIETNQAFAALVERKDSQYREAIAPLDTERESLVQEADRIKQARRALQSLAPSRARIAQHESDVLRLAGKTVEADLILAEMQADVDESEKLEARQQEIARECERIDAAKGMALRQAAIEFRDGCILLIRAAETTLAGLLDETRDALNSLEVQLAMPLYTPSELTSGEKSGEWATLHRLYSGAIRNR